MLELDQSPEDGIVALRAASSTPAHGTVLSGLAFGPGGDLWSAGLDCQLAAWRAGDMAAPSWATSVQSGDDATAAEAAASAQSFNPPFVHAMDWHPAGQYIAAGAVATVHHFIKTQASVHPDWLSSLRARLLTSSP